MQCSFWHSLDIVASTNCGTGLGRRLWYWPGKEAVVLAWEGGCGTGWPGKEAVVLAWEGGCGTGLGRRLILFHGKQ